MILNHRKILACIDDGQIRITPFDRTSIKPASYTLHFGRLAPQTNEHAVNKNMSDPQREDFELLPGHYIVVTSMEHLTLSESVAAMLSVRGSCARDGINALNSDLFVEPGWSGHLNLVISNIGARPVVLRHGMPLVKCIFYRVET